NRGIDVPGRLVGMGLAEWIAQSYRPHHLARCGRLRVHSALACARYGLDAVAAGGWRGVVVAGEPVAAPFRVCRRTDAREPGAETDRRCVRDLPNLGRTGQHPRAGAARSLVDLAGTADRMGIGHRRL